MLRGTRAPMPATLPHARPRVLPAAAVLVPLLLLALLVGPQPALADRGGASVRHDPRLHHPQRPALSPEEALERKRDAFLFGTAYVDNDAPIDAPPPSAAKLASALLQSPGKATGSSTLAASTTERTGRGWFGRKSSADKSKPQKKKKQKQSTASTARKVGNGIAHSSQNAASVISVIVGIIVAIATRAWGAISFVAGSVFALLLWPIIHIVWPPLAIILDPVFMTIKYLYAFWVATPLHAFLKLVRALYPLYLFLGAAVLTGLGLGFFATGGVVLGNVIIPVEQSQGKKEGIAEKSPSGRAPPKRRRSILDKAIAQREREWKRQQQHIQQQQQQQPPSQPQQYGSQAEPDFHKAQSMRQGGAGGSSAFVQPSRTAPAPTSPYSTRTATLREEPRSLSPIALARRSKAAAVAAAGNGSTGGGMGISAGAISPSASRSPVDERERGLPPLPSSMYHPRASGGSSAQGKGLSMAGGGGNSSSSGGGMYGNASPAVSPSAHMQPLPPTGASSSSGSGMHHRAKRSQQQLQQSHVRGAMSAST